MAVQDIARIEDKIDRAAAGATEISMGFGGVKFQTMIEVMEFSKLMAVSGSAVPPHLRLNPGGCLAICTRALRFGFDPFALAEHSFSMKKNVDVTVENQNGGRSTQKQEVETIAYDSYVVRAVIEAHAPIKGRISYSFEGEGDNRTCTVSATLRETGKVLSHTSPTLGARIKAIGKNDKGYIKGSPLWETKPDQQLGYDTARDFCRLHFPEVLMGWYDKDELEEAARAHAAVDVTPKPELAKRLTGGKKKGFDGEKIERTIDEAKPASEPVEKINTAAETLSPEETAKREAERIEDLNRSAELAAKSGERDFDSFWNKLSAQDRNTLGPSHDRLKAIALQSDKAVMR